MPALAMMRTAAAPEMMMDAAEDEGAPAPNMRMRSKSAAPGGGAGGGDVAAHAKIRSNFETTPLFLPSLAVGPTGEVRSRMPSIAALLFWTRSTTPFWTQHHAVAPFLWQVHVSWPLPDNTGAYEIRAYAVSPEHFGGGATAEQLVRKPLTMQVSKEDTHTASTLTARRHK